MGKIGEIIERPGRWRWVKLGKQKVQKQNFLREGLLGIEKGISWQNVREAKNIARLEEFHFSYSKPTLPVEPPHFHARGKIEILKMEELGDRFWEIQSYPSLLIADVSATRKGMFYVEAGVSGHIVDAALLLSFPAGRSGDQKTFDIGTPLDFSGEGNCCHYDLTIPAPVEVFSALPSRVDFALGMAYVNLEHGSEQGLYLAAAFRFKSIAEFPSFPLRDLKRIKGLSPI